MIEIQKIIGLLGVESTVPKLKEYMKINGVDLCSKLFVDQDCLDYYIERPEEGYCLVFTIALELDSEGRKYVPEGPEKVILAGVCLYSNGVDNYQQFSGILPENIDFSDSQYELINKLGETSWEVRSSDGLTIAAQSWNRSGYKIRISYKRDLKPAVITIYYYHY